MDYPDRGPYLTDGLLSVSGANGRYLVGETGNPVLLVGFHTWYDVQDGGGTDPPSAFGWDEYLAALLFHGCNFTKLWAMETARGWSDDTDQWFVPTRYERTGPGTDNDSKAKFDLTQVGADYLARLRSRVSDCQDAGIYVCVQLFQGWQVALNKGGTGDPCTYHPYLAANNINSVDGDQDDDGDLLETHLDTAANVVLSYQQALVEAIIDELNEFDNVLWEISNEDAGSADNTDWQKDMIAHIQTYEATKPKQHLIGMTVQWPDGNNSALDTSGADWVSYNGDKANAVHAATDPVSMYDTDHTVGLSSEYDWIWTSLCEGHGGAWYMDEWDGALYGSDRRNNATYVLIRENLGYALAFAKVIPLLDMTPQAALSSSGYCLAKDHASAAHYLCFYDGSSTFDLDMTTATGEMALTWLRCSTGETSATTVAGGSELTLTPPWTGAVVAYVRHG